MKKSLPPNNINRTESVRLSREDILQGQRLQDSPEAMLRLIDLIFGPGEWVSNIPS